MKLLIDSQTLIWLLYDSTKIGQESKRMLDDAPFAYISIISFWELAIKFSKNKTRLPYSPEELLAGAKALGLEQLPLLDRHIIELQNIQTPHNDPFDRMLLAQAKAENCTLLTSDKELLSTSYQMQSVKE